MKIFFITNKNLPMREGTRDFRHNKPKKNKTQKKIVFKKKSAFKKKKKKTLSLPWPHFIFK